MTKATFPAAYRGKNVLITGLTGFKGRWLGKWLSELGAKVTGFGLAPLPSPLNCRPDLRGQFECQEMDVRDYEAVHTYIAKAQPEIVFHLAAQPLVRASYATPLETFATNVMGVAHVLEAARLTDSVRAVINVTSDKCYENREWFWAYRETEAMGGHDPYSASKGCSELVTSSYRRSFGKDRQWLLASARAGNVIGGTDWSADRLIPDIARAVLQDQPIVIRQPACIRPWQHVLEALAGYLKLGEALLSNDESVACGWNFGPPDNDAVTVGELARAVVAHWGRGEIIENVDPNALHEAKYLKLDSSRAHALLDWAPLLSKQERIEWTVEWYREWSRAPENYWKLMREQIERYEQRLTTWNNRNRPSSPAAPASSAQPSRAV